MSYIESYLVMLGAFALVMYAGGIVWAITEYVLRRYGFYDEEEKV